MLIAVDGVSGSGKSTIAKKLAKEFDIAFFSVGLFYRAITFNAILNNISPNEDEKLEVLLQNSKLILTYNKDDGSNSCFLNGEDVTKYLDSERINQNVAHYSCKSYVLDYVHKLEKETAKHNRHMIMDGRDIGTVVFPGADLKLFITCDAKTRAQRRTAQLLRKGENVDFDQILQEINARDIKDQTRELCPLVKAEDAYIIDTTNITIAEGVAKAARCAMRDPFCKEFLNRPKAEGIVEYFQNKHIYRELQK